MQDTLITSETAKLAKEKGFDLSKVEIRDSNTLKIADNVEDRLDYFGTIEESNLIQLPTQSLLQMWLREKHNIHVGAFPIFYNRWFPTIRKFYKLKEFKDILRSPYEPNSSKNTYEEALEKGLREALKQIKL